MGLGLVEARRAVAESLYSTQWYRVARVMPRLAPQVRVQRQHWRDQRWHVLIDDASGRSHRLNDAAFQFIGRCDGQRTVHEVWSALLEQQRDQAPTQDEVLALLGQLGELDLLQAEGLADTEAQLHRQARRERRRRRAMLNPFSFRLPLGDPHPWLRRLDPLARALFSRGGAAAWLLLVLLGGGAALLNAPGLLSHGGTLFQQPSNVLTMWLAYPVMKALHELAHALAVRRFGGEVHEVGLGLMFLVPAPYVDASAANAMASRSRRAVVGAAGIAAELAVAAAGVLLWAAASPGWWLHDLGFVLALIGAGSTVLFNGNPMLRFDAYHVMCDLLELPNLATRSGAWWQAVAARHLLGHRSELPAHAASERKWLWAYAPLSLAWRVVLSFAIVLWLGGHWLLLGLAAAAYSLFGVLLKPLAQWARQSLQAALPGRDQARVRARLGFTAAAVVLAVCVLPLPFVTVAPAVVWLPEQAQVRTEVDGFVVEIARADGQAVAPGELLLRLDNPELRATHAQLASRLEGLRAEQYLTLMRDPNAAQSLAAELERLRAEMARVQQRLERLEVRAQAHGTLVMPRQADWQGAYLRQGQALGHVLTPGPMRVRAAVAQADAHLVRQQLRAAQVRVADDRFSARAAQLLQDTPAATRNLPSAALADVGGGPLASDPAAKDGVQTLEPVFLYDLTLPTVAADGQRVGARAWVRFDHGYQPLALQGYRRATQVFLKHFAPTG